jgi:hypothetical protein
VKEVSNKKQTSINAKLDQIIYGVSSPDSNYFGRQVEIGREHNKDFWCFKNVVFYKILI